MWQRFTERARKVVFYAQEEAQKFGEGYVSTEHLLLGLVREHGCAGVQVLHKLGVSPAHVKAEVEKLLPRGQAYKGQDMTLTPRAKRVIDLAYDEARQLGNNYIGTEHLLLGLIAEKDGLAARVLAKLGANLKDARTSVVKLQSEEEDNARLDLSKAWKGHPSDPTVEFRTSWSRQTPEARRALTDAVDLALEGRWPVCAGHIVLAALSKECVAQRAVSLVGNLEGVVEAMKTHLAQEPPEGSGIAVFTAESLDLVNSAVEIADIRHHEHVGTEHLLLAALDQDADGFAAYGITREAVLDALKQI